MRHARSANVFVSQDADSRTDGITIAGCASAQRESNDFQNSISERS